MKWCVSPLRAALVMGLAGLLVSCGGGTAPANLVATGGQAPLALDLLNAERMRCGFGSLRQSAALDRAARAHARWGVLSGQLSHTEDGNKYPLEFTGTEVADRVRGQGYPTGLDAVREVYAAFVNMPDTLGLESSAVRLLLNAPYHLVFLTGAYRDLGVSAQRPADVGLASGLDMVVMEMAHSATEGPQDLSPDVVATYPCEGSSGLVYSLSHETPNPVPGRNLAVSPLGVSVVIRVRQGQVLRIDQVSMTAVRTGTPVALRAHVGGVNGLPDTYVEFDRSVAYVVADAPMQPQTAYAAQVTGANNGMPFVKRFTFTTGDLAFNAMPP